MKVLNIYTDGGYRPMINLGAYAFVVVDNSDTVLQQSVKVIDSAVVKDAVTNNRMEMMAVIKSLNWIKSNGINPQNHRIYVYTDSQYVQLGLTEWLSNWKRNNWRTSNRKPVVNQDLWRILDKLWSFEFPYLHLQWTQGHNGNKWNETVDKMCTESMVEYDILINGGAIKRSY